MPSTNGVRIHECCIRVRVGFGIGLARLNAEALRGWFSFPGFGGWGGCLQRLPQSPLHANGSMFKQGVEWTGPS